jgi:hypothetical protein
MEQRKVERDGEKINAQQAIYNYLKNKT